MRETRLPASVAKRFRSGRACLDFLHTGGSGDWVEPELLRDRAALERWLAHVLGLAGVRARDDDLIAAHRLRGALWQLVRARIEGREFAVDDVETLNAFAALAPPVPRLTAEGTSAPVVAMATDALSAIARDAVDLLTGPLGHRIRVCAAQDCAFLFVDASRPGSRRWCSMQRCGNLAKVRAYRATAANGE
jgi:predicted RNA-binding Zn ribbon-like protein